LRQKIEFRPVAAKTPAAERANLEDFAARRMEYCRSARRTAAKWLARDKRRRGGSDRRPLQLTTLQSDHHEELQR
jgi:hypothetical protein